MALAEWPPRRIAIIWSIGIALQVIMVVVPIAHARNFVPRDLTALRQRVMANRERDRGQDYADSISRAAQIDSARASGQYRIGAAGDTVFAVVGMPSGRATPEQVAARRAAMERGARRALFVWFGAIPLALTGLTLAWLVARRRDADASGSVRASMFFG